MQTMRNEIGILKKVSLNEVDGGQCHHSACVDEGQCHPVHVERNTLVLTILTTKYEINPVNNELQSMKWLWHHTVLTFSRLYYL